MDIKVYHVNKAALIQAMTQSWHHPNQAQQLQTSCSKQQHDLGVGKGLELVMTFALAWPCYWQHKQKIMGLVQNRDDQKDTAVQCGQDLQMLFEYHKQPIKFIFKYLKVCILIKMFNSVFIGLKGMDCTKGNSMGSSLKLSFETTVYLLQVSINSIKTYVLNNIINKKQSINGTWTTYNHPSNTQCHISSCLVLQQHGNLCIPKEGWV